MKTRRIVGSLLATALASATLAVVTTATPASAAVTVETRFNPTSSDRPIISSYSTPVKYGDSISIYADVQAFVDGAWTDIYRGSVTVTEQVAGSTQASQVATGDSAWVIKSVPAHGNATYTLSYSGGNNYDGSVIYAPVTAAYSIKNVQRKIDVIPQSGRKLGLGGKISPAGKLKVLVLQKVGRKWKRYKAVTSTARGTFFAKLPAPAKRGKKLFWKLQVAGSGAFSTTQTSIYYTTKY